MRLRADFFDRPADVVALELLGKHLVHGDKSAAITATEAYFAEGDGASHLRQPRKAKRAREAFDRGPGTIYIHFIHGWHCMDLIAGNGSVLLCSVRHPKGNGPHKALSVLGIEKNLHTLRVTDSDSSLWLEDAPIVAGGLVVSPRRGVKAAADLPLRFELGDVPAAAPTTG